MPEITLEHIRQAAEWAKTAKEQPMPIDGQERVYDQSTFDCGTACCVWGAANIIAGIKPEFNANVTGCMVNLALIEVEEWAEDDKSVGVQLLAGLMLAPRATPDQMLAVLDRIPKNDFTKLDLSGLAISYIDLPVGTDLSGSIFTGVDSYAGVLRGLILRDADFTAVDDAHTIDFTDSDLRGAVFARRLPVHIQGAKIEGMRVKFDTDAGDVTVVVPSD